MAKAVTATVASAAAVTAAVTAAVNEMSTTITRLIGFLILIAAFVLAFFLVQSFVSRDASNSGQSSGWKWLSATVQKQREGDFSGALAEARLVQDDPGSSAEAKALATLNTLGAEYRVTGEASTRLSDVKKMKEIIMNESVSLWTRVSALNTLAGQYSISGGDSAVFAEIFKDKPFSDYFASAEDPDRTARLSARKLFEWSYSMRPTSFAAINISRWYSEQMLFNPNLPTSTRTKDLDIAEDYLKKADAVSLEEAKQDSSYSDSGRYLVYRYWRTVIFGRLAGPTRPEYLSEYRATYDEFISFAKAQRNVLAEEYLSYARLYYAAKLALEKDTVGAKTQLDLLADEMSLVSDPSVSVFMRFLRNEYTNRPTGPSWKNLVENKYAISPKFKAAVEKVIASAGQ